MEKVKVLIVEDEDLYADKLEMLIEKLGYEHLATADNSADALDCVTNEKPDFILMDVNIQGEYYGIELSEQVQKIRTTPIIFITSLADDMTFSRIKRTQPNGFLLKPFNEVQLQRSMELAVSKLNKNLDESDITEKEMSEKEAFVSKDSFWVKHKSSLKKVITNEIIYIQAEGKYCTLYLKESRYVTRTSMAQLLEKLDSNSFFQTHKSYSVNLDFLESIDGSLGIVIAGEYEIPLSRRMKEELKLKLNLL